MKKIEYTSMAIVLILCIMQGMTCYNLYQKEKITWQHHVENDLSESMAAYFSNLSSPEHIYPNRFLCFDPGKRQIKVNDQGNPSYFIYIEKEIGLLEVTRRLMYDMLKKESFLLQELDSVVHSRSSMGTRFVFIKQDSTGNTIEKYARQGGKESSMQSCTMKLGFLSQETLRVLYSYPFSYFWQKCQMELLLFIGLFISLLLGTSVLFLAYRNQYRQNKFQEQMLQQVMHDFKGPLGAVKSSIEHWRSSLTGEEKEAKRYELTRSALISMEKNMSHMLSMVTGMCSIHVVRQPFNLKEELEKLIYMWNLNENRYCHLFLDYRLPVQEVYLSKTYFTCAVSNLIDNAIKYSNKEPYVTIRCYNQGEGMILEVEDKGIGMSEKECLHIFKPYYRANPESATMGCGMGLPFVLEVVNKHGGKIRVESQPGKGSTFSIYIKRWRK